MPAILPSSGLSDLSETDYRALADFRYQIRHFLHFSEAAAKREGLEPQQHQLLLALCAYDPLGPTIGELAERLLIRPHSAVGLIDRMEARGLVERTHTEKDRRQVRIRMTAEGREKLRRLSSLHQAELRRTGPKLVEALRTLLEGLPPEHGRAF
jgi:DNA-binding MarR family transcriptional regulator